MSAWRSPDGRMFREVQVASLDNEINARAWCVAQGATLRNERMVGALYRTAEGRSFRVTARGWAAGFVVLESQEVQS